MAVVDSRQHEFNKMRSPRNRQWKRGGRTEIRWEAGRDVWAEDRAEISHRVEFGRTDRESLSVLCLAASQLSRLMEIPSLIAAARADGLCRHVV